MMHEKKSGISNINDSLSNFALCAVGLLRQIGFTAVFLMIVLFLGTSKTFAQEYTHNTADQKLRSAMEVNPSSLALELEIPLANYPGRAGMNFPIVWSYSSKVWRMEYVSHLGLNPHSSGWKKPVYSELAASGWKSSMGAPYFQVTTSYQKFNSSGSPGQASPQYVVHRIQVHMPDGSSHELRQGDFAVSYGPGMPINDDGVYYAVDGSGLKLVYYGGAGSPPDVLYLPDGSRYVYDDTAAYITYIDRNGNTNIYPSYGGTSWTDSLGRNYSPGSGSNDVTYNYPGLDGSTPLTYIFRWRPLTDVRTDPTQALRYRAPLTPCNLDTGNPLSPSLFEGSTTCVEEYQGEAELFNPSVLHEIVLPNGKSYTFTYNVYGEIDKVVYPTGSYERFRHDQLPALSPAPGGYTQTNRGVVEKWISPTGNSSDEIRWQYFATSANNIYTVTTVAPDGSRIERLLHADTGPRSFRLDNVLLGMAYEERSFSPTGQMLRRKLNQWIAGSNNPNYQNIRDPRVTREVEIIFEGSGDALAQSTTYQHDQFLNVISATTYDYVVLDNSTAQNAAIGSISLGTPLITAETTYNTDSNYLARQMIRLPISTRIKQGDSNGPIVAQSEIAYDEQTYPLSYGSSVPGWSDPQTSVRGNVTTAKNWLNTLNGGAGGWLEAHLEYDQCGSARKSWDAKGNLSQIEYSQNYAYAFPTKALTPKPALTPNPITNQYHGSQTEFETTTEYNFNTGLLTKVIDANGQETRTEYNDSLLRPTRIIRPTNGGETLIEYSDVVGNLYVKTKMQIDATSYAESTTYFDKLGRAVKTQTKDSQGDVFAETQYDQFGRAWKASHPYRQGQTVYWTTTAYDDLSRVRKITTPDGAEGETFYSLSTAGSLFGSVVIAEDQANKQRRSVTDALGRLSRVDEPDANNNLGSIDTPVQPTSYSYDILGNLRTVTQGVQQRTFVYDSLSRLTSATNPELGTTPTNGTINYTYDPNGNLSTKTDPRGITTTYSYDALSRVVLRDYSDSTPDISYFYDGKGLSSIPSNSKGALTKVSNSVSETRYTGFDVMGRVTSSQQVTQGLEECPGTNDPCTMTYSYNLAGALVSQTYPSGRVVTNSFDTNGMLANVSSKANSSAVSRTYANAFTYNAAGAVSSMRLGNGRFESTQFNSRLQPTQIALGMSAGNTSLLKLDYTYGVRDSQGNLDETKNNGNVESQTITVPAAGINPGFVAVQSYTYDSLNRLKSAKEKESSTENWKQTFDYDRYGNRNFDMANTTFPNTQTESEKVINPEILESNNRFKLDQDNDSVNDYLYDENGNLTKDASGKRFVYDAENKQKSFGTNGSSTDGGSYFYDGDGKRVKKYVVATGETTLFVYNASRQIVAEYSTATAQNPKTVYLTSDKLGSPRINTNASGQVVARHDYFPYGEEIISGQLYSGGRTNQIGYVSDSIRQKFTSYQRDFESENDYAIYRYYSPGLGRFNLPDEPFADQWEDEPQSWNLYAYVRNNPLNYVDPFGRWIKVAENTWLWEDGDTWETLAEKIGGITPNLLANFFHDVQLGAGVAVNLDVFIKEGGYISSEPVYYTGSEQDFLADSAMVDVPEYEFGGGGGIVRKLPRMHRLLPGAQKAARDRASGVLSNAMQKAGQTRPPNTAAHHIVAFGALRAQFAQRVLRRFNIDINAAENGVYLPMTVHQSLHSHRYYDAVNRLLAHAKTKDEVLQVLEYIKTELLKGAFPP